MLEGLSETEQDEEYAVLREEFEKALRDLKPKKAAGIDEIQAELWKEAGENMLNELFKLIKDIYRTADIPTDFVKSIVIPIPKKTSVKKCEQYRTISLLSHASKILTKIMFRRMEKKIEDTLSEDQFGFRKNRGTREAILALRLIIEKRIRKDKSTFIAFVDIEKAFDNVNWEIMFKMLRRAGVAITERKLLYQLYKNEIAIIKMENIQKESRIKKGVRQGCTLSPLIFNAYIQEAIDIIRDKTQLGIKINGYRIDMLRFADDIAIVAENERDLRKILKTMELIMEKDLHMKMNSKKTKIVVCSRDNPRRTRIKLNDNEIIEQVEDFTYLGSIISSDGKCKKEIIKRICQAKVAFNKKRSLFTSKNIDLRIRKKLLKTYIWSIMLYGCETWIIAKEERRRIEAFEMWCYRRMEKIRWTDRMTNEEVLERVSEKKSIWKSIQKRRNELIGHILRHDGLLGLILEGLVDGKNHRGRPRLQYISQIIEDQGCSSYQELKRKASDREAWKLLQTNR